MVTSLLRGKMGQVLFLLLVFLISGAESLYCHSCDSSADSNCATLKDVSNFSSDTCENSEDQCATWIDDARTLRACSSKMLQEFPMTSLCDADLCNNIVYPENRLTCYSCQGADCLLDQVSEVCANYIEADSCYSLKSGENYYKGCSSDVETEGSKMCQEMPSECKTCDTNACNSEDFQPKTELRCFSCSSRTEGDCMFLQEEGSNEENCIDEHCFTFSNETHFMRGCLSDFLASPDLCRDNCVYCQTDNCNSAQLMEQVCYSCDSTIDENCILNPNATEQTTCDQSVAQHSGCYHHERDGITHRGCVVDLTEEDALDCSNGELCKKCKTNLCNDRQEIPSCFVCRSDEDPDCVDQQSSDSSMKVCDLYTDSCRKFVVPTTRITERGCSHETENVTCTETTINCQDCQGKGCNDGIIPGDRQRCHKCTGDECLDSSPSICPNYYFRDLCYSHLGENGDIISRGCTSDDGKNAEACQENSQFCFTCSENGCNNVVYRAPTLSCIICDSLDMACIWGYPTSAATRCRQDVLLTRQESCFIFKHEEHGLFMRGCTLDTNICGMYADAECQICEEDGCNNVQIEEQYCINCSSLENKACAEDAETIAPILCGGNFQYSMRGCYSINKDELVTRGCFNDLDSDSRWDCDRDIMNETCSRCFENACNVESFSSGTRTEISLALVILCIICKFI